jgi:hypothetical protein
MGYTLQTVLFSLFIVVKVSDFVDTAEEAYTNSHDSRMHRTHEMLTHDYIDWWPVLSDCQKSVGREDRCTSSSAPARDCMCQCVNLSVYRQIG